MLKRRETQVVTLEERFKGFLGDDDDDVVHATRSKTTTRCCVLNHILGIES